MEKAELKEAVNESIKELLAESQMGSAQRVQEQKNLDIRKINNGFIVGGYTPGYLGRAEVYCSNLDDLISYIRGELS